MKSSLLFLLFCVHIQLAQAQNTNPHDLSVETARKHAVSLYSKAISKNSHLYNGKEYVEYEREFTGHPFYIDNIWEKGTIEYDGILYENIDLKYDIYKEQLITSHFLQTGRGISMILTKGKTTKFSFANHAFVHLKDSLAIDIPEGYYDLVYDGEVQVYVKRLKSKVEATSAQGRYFKENDVFYIKKDGFYHKVNSKGSVLKVYETNKKELKQYFKKNYMLYRDNKQAVIIMLSAQYDLLNN